MAGKAAQRQNKPNEPSIENRKARHEFFIEDTLECGLELTGTEIKSVRAGQISLGEGYVRAVAEPLSLTLYAVHIAEYPPAGEVNQHKPTRARRLLAHKREIRKLSVKTQQKGFTLVPLKVYFLRGKAKLLIGLGRGKQKADKREDSARKQAKREIERAMSRRR